MKYHIHLQEKPHWCVPACLQSILESRGFSMTQQNIVERLNITQNGLEQFNKAVLNKFLEEYNLNCEFTNPFLTGIEPDLWLEEELNNKDILVAYNYLKLHNLKGEGKHVSIVTEYLKVDKVELLDPSKEELMIVPLYGINSSLYNSIQSKEDIRYGFYIISQGTLANLLGSGSSSQDSGQVSHSFG